MTYDEFMDDIADPDNISSEEINLIDRFIKGYDTVQEINSYDCVKPSQLSTVLGHFIRKGIKVDVIFIHVNDTSILDRMVNFWRDGADVIPVNHITLTGIKSMRYSTLQKGTHFLRAFGPSHFSYMESMAGLYGGKNSITVYATKHEYHYECCVDTPNFLNKLIKKHQEKINIYTTNFLYFV